MFYDRRKATAPLGASTATLGIRQDLLAGSRLVQVNPSQCSVHPLNTRDLQASASHIAQLREDMVARGQLEPALGIPGPNNSVVLLRGACRGRALEGLEIEGRPVSLAVLLLPICTRLQAERIINTEQTRTRSWSAWELSLHYDKLGLRIANRAGSPPSMVRSRCCNQRCVALMGRVAFVVRARQSPLPRNRRFTRCRTVSWSDVTIGCSWCDGSSLSIVRLSRSHIGNTMHGEISRYNSAFAG